MDRSLCLDCGHDGYDGHEMRMVPPMCMTPGCTCGSPLFRPTLNTVSDVESWISSWGLVGGFPHPDDSAWTTCEQEVALGFGDYHAKHLSHDEGGHLGISGPAAPQNKTDALALDAAMAEAHSIVNAADGDIYAMVVDALPPVGDVTVYLRVDLVIGDGEAFTTQDAKDALLARLSEVYPTDDAYPNVPTVTFIDGPDATR